MSKLSPVAELRAFAENLARKTLDDESNDLTVPLQIRDWLRDRSLLMCSSWMHTKGMTAYRKKLKALRG